MALYCVIYDETIERSKTRQEAQERADAGEVHERSYYGYFSSIEEARKMYDLMRGNNNSFVNARIMEQVEVIPEIKDHDINA